MSEKTHPVVFSFGGAEHHLTMAEAQSAIGRLNAAITAATMAQERASRAMRELLEAKAREDAPPVDRSRRCTVGEAVAPGEPNTEDRGDGQQKGYVILCDDERAKGFVRPVRRGYVHVGTRPKYPTRDLTPEESRAHEGCEYVKFEPYPDGSPERGPGNITGRYWTAKQLRSGCGTLTTMGQKLAETYARDPGFYSGTFCCGCGAHFPVGAAGEFVWDGTDERVGT